MTVAVERDTECGWLIGEVEEEPSRVTEAPNSRSLWITVRPYRVLIAQRRACHIRIATGAITARAATSRMLSDNGRSINVV